MSKNSSREVVSCALSAAAFFLFLQPAASLRAAPVIFHLKGGDRIAGTVLSESTNGVVIATSWCPELCLPLTQIESRQAFASPTNRPAHAAAHLASVEPGKPVVVEAPKAPSPVPLKPWKFDAKLGMDIIQGEKDRKIYYGQFALRYARPYKSNPRESFRNTMEYRVDYATTDDIESANRMFGSDKTDFDIGDRVFVYNFGGAGYDDVRKIDLQYEVGPGLGYHLLRTGSLQANVEGGFSYQVQDRRNSERIESIYSRVAQDVTWKFYPQMLLSQRATLLTRVDAPEQMQLRLEANLGLGVVKGISFNLTAIELYDTRPVPGVTPSEFQLRSAIGLAF